MPARGLHRALALLAAAGVLLASGGGCRQQTPSPPAPPAASAEPAASDEGLIVAVGDSLTAGQGVDERDAWPARLERRLRSEGLRWKVVNAGISGETSAGARARMAWVLGTAPDIVILETGANDGMRGLPPSVLRENLDALLVQLRERGVTVVLAGMQMLRNLGPSYTEAFARIYPELAAKHGVILIPFFLEGVAGVPERNLPDGIHPNPQGHQVISELVYPHVREAISLAQTP